jgi:hypothetical protein
MTRRATDTLAPPGWQPDPRTTGIAEHELAALRAAIRGLDDDRRRTFTCLCILMLLVDLPEGHLAKALHRLRPVL